MITVTVLTRANCPSCDEILAALTELQKTFPHRLLILDLDQNPALMQKYGHLVPVVEVGPYRLQYPFTSQDLQATIGAAHDRFSHLEKVGDSHFAERLNRGHTLTGADKFSYWLGNHYMLVFNLIVLVYIGLPFLSPIFMKNHWDGPASVIYKIYSPLCHQLAYRSWFLFGNQPAYPRALAHVQGLVSFEQTTGIDPLNISASRDFIGNDVIGYKVAICERDVAIYGSILIFGLLYAGTGRKLRALPWYFWLILGIIPIAVDGFSQLPSLMNVSWLSWFPMRESTPLLRTITGGLFGFSTAWFGYPYVEDSMAETRQIMEKKLALFTKEKNISN